MNVFYSHWRKGRGCVLATFVALLSVCLALVAFGQNASYTTVKAEDLVSAPQRYWARAIIFQDHVSAPAATRSVRIEDKRYIPFTTRIVGTCYATEELAPTVASFQVGRRYAFSGMVIQSRGRYHVIVSGVQPVMDATAVLHAIPSQSDVADVTFEGSALKPLVEIVQQVQSEHIAYAQELGIPLCELYDRQSVHFPRALDIVRSTIMKREMEEQTVSAEMLAQYLIAAIARACTASNEMSSTAQKTEMPARKAPKPEAAVRPDQEAEITAKEHELPVLLVEPSASAVELPPPTGEPPASAVESGEPRAEEVEEVLEPVPTEKRLAFSQRWKARHAQRQEEQQRLAEEQVPLKVAGNKPPEIEEEAVKRKQSESSSQEPEQPQTLDEEWNQPVLRARKPLDALPQIPASTAQEHAPVSLLPDHVGPILAEEGKSAPEQMQHQEDTSLDEETVPTKAEEQEKQTGSEGEALKRREAEEKKRLAEEQRALREAAKRKAKEAQRAAELAASEARKRATTSTLVKTDDWPQVSSPANKDLRSESPPPQDSVVKLSRTFLLRQKETSNDTENQSIPNTPRQIPNASIPAYDPGSDASNAPISDVESPTVVIDLAVDPSSKLLAPPLERIEKLRRAEEKHFERFRKNMLREAERQERRRRQLDQQIQRQLSR